MMQVMAIRILWEVAENIQNVDFYSIMCDEATDVKNVSKLAVRLRWVDDELEAHDEFISLKNMPNTDADSIVWKLKDVLLQMHLKLNKLEDGVMTNVPLCLVQKAGSLYESKAKKNVHYIPIATHIFNQSSRSRHDESMPHH